MPVYLIRAGGFVKIGHTSRLGRRLREHQRVNRQQLQVMRLFVGGPAEERHLHRLFAPHREHGEWFRFHPEMLRPDLGLWELRWLGWWHRSLLRRFLHDRAAVVLTGAGVGIAAAMLGS